MFWSEADYYEERDSHVASPSEAIAEFAWNAGAEEPDRAWLSHDWDVWVKNPHYAGPPVPHPESDWEGPYEEEGVKPSGKPPMKSAWPDDDDIPF